MIFLANAWHKFHTAITDNLSSPDIVNLIGISQSKRMVGVNLVDLSVSTSPKETTMEGHFISCDRPGIVRVCH